MPAKDATLRQSRRTQGFSSQSKGRKKWVDCRGKKGKNALLPCVAADSASSDGDNATSWQSRRTQGFSSQSKGRKKWVDCRGKKGKNALLPYVAADSASSDGDNATSWQSRRTQGFSSQSKGRKSGLTVGEKKGKTPCCPTLLRTPLPAMEIMPLRGNADEPRGSRPSQREEKSGLTGTRTQNQYLKRVLLYH